MENTEIVAASAADVDAILEIICARMDWMDQKGLFQWNATDYLTCYPRSYFEEGAERGDFYLMKQQGQVIAEMALFEKDGRWDDDPAYFYVHHLATLPGCSGAGVEMLRFAEHLGRKRKKRGIRLDSAVDNEALAAYYEALGYFALSTFTEGAYEGMRRVKYLGLPLAFRAARQTDLEELWQLEELCFPPQERCLRKNFERRLALWPEHFLLLFRPDTGRICAFLSDIYAEQAELTDAMFTEAVQHDPAGKNLVVLGLNTCTDLRGRGLASMLMRRRIAQARRAGLHRCVLTCHDFLVPYYASFGYVCKGISQSVWGGETWYDMVLELD